MHQLDAGRILLSGQSVRTSRTGAVVGGLSRLEHIVPAVQELGRRHARYGVEDHHYGMVGTALLWTLGKTLGAEFAPAVKDSWATVYGVLATTMRQAASTVPA